MRITCPFCGDRGHEEFAYLGAGGLTRPAADHPDIDKAMFDYVYLRDNPAGRHRELWYHAAGCRRWLSVVRDTRTHEIESVTFTALDPGAAS